MNETAMEEGKETLVIVNSYDRHLDWVESTNQAILEKLGQDFNIAIFDMNSEQLTISTLLETAAQAKAFILKNHPKLVFLGDDCALALLGHFLAEQGIPGVFFGINANPRDYLDNEDMLHVTGVLERPLFMRSLVLLSEVMPNMRRVHILMGNSNTSRIILKETFGNLPQQDIGEIQVHISLITDWLDWQRTVLDAEHQGYDALFASVMHTIGFPDRQEHLSFDYVARWTSHNSPVPVFGFWNMDVGPEKAVGGLVLFGTEQGNVASQMARRILLGVSPLSIPPVTADHGLLVFSRSQLQRWNLVLPPKILDEAVILP